MDFRITFKFSKKGLMKYISHLDLMRLFTRAFRRADMPVKMSQGFNPHIKFSIKRALKLGLESDNEEASLELKQKILPEEFLNKLNRQLPAGILVREVTINAKGNIN